MGKKYQGEICVYCVKDAASNTSDHVICRQFFRPIARDNLPKVPACRRCNGEKAALEHYLTTVMPFGARHLDAGQTLAEMVPPRLAKNSKLHASLAKGLGHTLVSINDSYVHDRRNWRFVGSQQAGERAGVILSLIESAKLNGHDPWAYLKNVFERLPTLKHRDLAQLPPHNWRPATDVALSAPVTAPELIAA